MPGAFSYMSCVMSHVTSHMISVIVWRDTNLGAIGAYQKLECDQLMIRNFSFKEKMKLLLPFADMQLQHESAEHSPN